MWLSGPQGTGPAFDVANISSYCSLVLAILGVLGNGLLIRLTLNNEVRKLTCCIFLFALAITDSIVLIYEAMDDVALHIPGLDMYDILFGYNEWRCRLGVFFYQTARTMSAWLVVAMATELCLAASLPSRRWSVYNQNRALYVTLAVTLVATAAGFPFLVLTQNVDGSNENGRCSSVYETFYLVYSTFVLKGATQCGVPSIFILVCGIKSAVTLRKQSGGSRNRFQSKGISGNQYLDRSGAPLSSAMPCQASKVIGTLTAVYVLSVLPSTITELSLFAQIFTRDAQITWAWYLAVNVTNVLLLVNYAFKFFVILLVGAEFRGPITGRSSAFGDGHHMANGLAVRGAATTGR